MIKDHPLPKQFFNDEIILKERPIAGLNCDMPLELNTHK